MTPAQIETVKATANELIKRDEAIARLRAALKPFADFGIGSGPDDQQDDYRIEYGAIRAARAAIEAAS